MPTISGIVRDKLGVPCARQLRFYRRDTGAYLGSTDSFGRPATSGDPHWANVVSLLHFDETATKDQTGRTWSLVGTQAVLRPGSAMHGPNGLRIDGRDSCIQTINPIKDSTVNFTIEFFVRVSRYQMLTSPAEYMLYNQGSTGGWGFYGMMLSNTQLYLTLEGGSSAGPTGSATGVSSWFPLNAFVHIAHTFDGTKHRVFVDGVEKISLSTTTGWKDPGQPFSIGRGYLPSLPGETRGCEADFDEFRITKGVARYTSNFTPPTQRFDDGVTGKPELPVGSYEFTTAYEGEIQAICLDSATAAPIENDMILRTFAV